MESNDVKFTSEEHFEKSFNRFRELFSDRKSGTDVTFEQIVYVALELCAFNVVVRLIYFIVAVFSIDFGKAVKKPPSTTPPQLSLALHLTRSGFIPQNFQGFVFIYSFHPSECSTVAVRHCLRKAVYCWASSTSSRTMALVRMMVTFMLFSVR